MATANLDDATVQTYTQALVDEGELKLEFQDALGDNATKIWVTGKGYDPADTSIQAIVCFDPDSKALSADATTIYNSDGTDNSANCPSTTAVATCYWCAR